MAVELFAFDHRKTFLNERTRHYTAASASLPQFDAEKIPHILEQPIGGGFVFRTADLGAGVGFNLPESNFPASHQGADFFQKLRTFLKNRAENFFADFITDHVGFRLG